MTQLLPEEDGSMEQYNEFIEDDADTASEDGVESESEQDFELDGEEATNSDTDFFIWEKITL